MQVKEENVTKYAGDTLRIKIKRGTRAELARLAQVQERTVTRALSGKKQDLAQITYTSIRAMALRDFDGVVYSEKILR